MGISRSYNNVVVKSIFALLLLFDLPANIYLFFLQTTEFNTVKRNAVTN